MVKLEIQSLLSDKPSVEKSPSVGEKVCNSNNRLVEQLHSEIIFLRKEILSKNKIIEVLISDNKKVSNDFVNLSSVNASNTNVEQYDCSNMSSNNENNWSTVQNHNKRNQFKRPMNTGNSLKLN